MSDEGIDTLQDVKLRDIVADDKIIRNLPQFRNITVLPNRQNKLRRIIPKCLENRPVKVQVEMVDGAQGDVHFGAFSQLFEGELAVTGGGVNGGADEAETAVHKTVLRMKFLRCKNNIQIRILRNASRIFLTKLLRHSSTPAQQSRRFRQN